MLKNKKLIVKDADYDESEIWEYLIDSGLCTEEALHLLTNINGYSVETLNDAIFSLTGYRDLSQLKDEDEEDEIEEIDYDGLETDPEFDEFREDIERKKDSVKPKHKVRDFRNQDQYTDGEATVVLDFNGMKLDGKDYFSDEEGFDFDYYAQVLEAWLEDKQPKMYIGYERERLSCRWSVLKMDYKAKGSIFAIGKVTVEISVEDVPTDIEDDYEEAEERIYENIDLPDNVTVESD